MRMCLNIGCGDKPTKSTSEDSWTNVDIRAVPGVDRVCYADVLPFPDEEFDRVDAIHILEHFQMCRTFDILKEWTRVLKQGGMLYLAVPDLFRVMEWVVDNDIGWEGAMAYFYGGQKHNHDMHYSGFCKEYLSRMMRLAGLVVIDLWDGNAHDASSSKLSLNLRGTKK